MVTNPYTLNVTIDVESDWGGRTQDITGIKEGLPLILGLLKKYDQKAIFFISTELTPKILPEIEAIKKEGHPLGSHGHFHIIYKDKWRAWQDKEISCEIIKDLKDPLQKIIPYRAPKFSFEPNGDRFAGRENHVGLLRHLWFGGDTKGKTLYLHPFDIVGGIEPPSLFCRLWYSLPELALKHLEKLIANMSGKSTE